MSHGVHISCQADFTELETDKSFETEEIKTSENNPYLVQRLNKHNLKFQDNEKHKLD